MNKASGNQHVRKMKNHICLTCSGMTACPWAFCIYHEWWERQHVSELQPLFPAASHGTGLPCWGYFHACWFCLLSKGQSRRRGWHWQSDLKLCLCWEALRRADVQGEILLSRQNSQLAHTRTVHLRQEHRFCTSLLSNRQEVVEENSCRWWGSWQVMEQWPG